MGKDAVDKLREGFCEGAMDPDGIYYESGSGSFHVDVGEHYRRFS